ncbi:unnamed protein product, partial [Closterium sp. NIES-53]
VSPVMSAAVEEGQVRDDPSKQQHSRPRQRVHLGPQHHQRVPRRNPRPAPLPQPSRHPPNRQALPQQLLTLLLVPLVPFTERRGPSPCHYSHQAVPPPSAPPSACEWSPLSTGTAGA